MVLALPDEAFAAFDSGDTAWVLVSAALVLLMTPGLAFFYSGLSRGKSALNMMMMSFGALGVVSVVYVLWGYSMSFSSGHTGESDILGIFDNPFSLFGLSQLLETREIDGEELSVIGGFGTVPAIVWVGFQLTFAVITVALISGALAERVRFGTWLVFSVLWATFAYFPLAHMVWGGGLLSDAENGFASWLFGYDAEAGAANVAPIDFAGGEGTVPAIPFHRVLAGAFDPDQVRGKVVVVGATAPELQDVHPVLDGLMSGPEVHANAIQTVLDGYPLRDAPAWLAVLLIVAFQGGLARSVTMPRSTLGWYSVAGLMAAASQIFVYMALALAPASIVTPIQRTSLVMRVWLARWLNPDLESFDGPVLLATVLSLIGAAALAADPAWFGIT